MNRTRRCLYNAIRDASTLNGVACVMSWDDLADTCGIMPRQAQEVTARMERDELLVRCGNPGRKCFVPLDPDPTRRQVFHDVVSQTQFGIVAMARVALMLSQGKSVSHICEILATDCTDILYFATALRQRGYFGERHADPAQT